MRFRVGKKALEKMLLLSKALKLDVARSLQVQNRFSVNMAFCHWERRFRRDLTRQTQELEETQLLRQHDYDAGQSPSQER